MYILNKLNQWHAQADASPPDPGSGIQQTPPLKWTVENGGVYLAGTWICPEKHLRRWFRVYPISSGGLLLRYWGGTMVIETDHTDRKCPVKSVSRFIHPLRFRSPGKQIHPRKILWW